MEQFHCSGYFHGSLLPTEKQLPLGSKTSGILLQLLHQAHASSTNSHVHMCFPTMLSLHAWAGSVLPLLLSTAVLCKHCTKSPSIRDIETRELLIVSTVGAQHHAVGSTRWVSVALPLLLGVRTQNVSGYRECPPWTNSLCFMPRSKATLRETLP